MRRPKRIYNSQCACVQAWLKQTQPEGWAKGWWRPQRALHFVGARLYSCELAEVEVARLVTTPTGTRVVLVRKDRDESLMRSYRTQGVRHYTQVADVPWVNVPQLDDFTGTRAWYAERVQRAVGRWQRCRLYKHWRSEQVERVLQQRAAYEQAFGLRRTRDEAEVRVMRVVTRLTASTR